MATVPRGSHRPVTPSRPRINGHDATAEYDSKAMKSVRISAVVDDPDAAQPVRLVVYYTDNNWKTQHGPVHGTFDSQTSRGKGVWDAVTLGNLKTNTLYKAKLYSQAKVGGSAGYLSINHNSVSFWTNRPPLLNQVAPAQNQEIPDDQDFLFDWQFADPDSGDSQKSYQIQYRDVGSATWKTVNPTTTKDGKNTFRLYHASNLTANTHYVWQVRAKDQHDLWGGWTVASSFFVRGLVSPPQLVAPLGGVGHGAVVTDPDHPLTFSWKFRDPDPGNSQYQADIRWRVKDAGGGYQTIAASTGEPSGDEGWFMLPGTADMPGVANQWQVPPGYFIPGYLYEWQVRTYDTPDRLLPSGWSTSGYFTATGIPGWGNTEALVIDNPEVQGALGCGNHRVFVYDRGGQSLRGEITPLVQVQWNRKRDDIGNALITTNGFSYDCCELLGSLRSWMHELVIYRDGERVFEGPITRITYMHDSVEVEAKDVMAYLYRRIMREGYDDHYRRVDLTPLTPSEPLPSTKGGPYLITGQATVVRRAAQITLNALAYQDPNVLPYLTIFDNANDALNSRVVPDFSRTAWEEIDDLAATAGLDYVTIGRRIMYWDTHRAIGRLPEMRDGDFNDPVIVTEYGMQTSNFFAVTNNSGQWGAKFPKGLTDVTWSDAYGPVEMLASAYGETEGDAVSTEALTPADVDALRIRYEEQARRNIAHRWPTPLVVRVPDNSTLNPDVNLGINQLVPGVWLPLRATLTCRNVTQWQKLDEVSVTQAGSAEAIQVTMSPAPNGGDDDPDGSATEASD